MLGGGHRALALAVHTNALADERSAVSSLRQLRRPPHKGPAVARDLGLEHPALRPHSVLPPDRFAARAPSLRGARHGGWRCVRLVGHRAETQEGVLQIEGAVQSLRTPPARDSLR